MTALPPSLLAAIDSGGRGLTVLPIRLGAMGDIVRTLPAVRLVRRGLPHARIHWVAWQPWAELLDGHADLDGTIPIPRRDLRNAARSPSRWPELMRGTAAVISRVRAVRPQLVLDFHGDLRSGLIGAFSGAAVRLGYEGHQQKEGNRLLTTHRVAAGARRRSRIERNLDLVRALGLADGPVPDAGLPLSESARSAARSVVTSVAPGGGAYAVINPGASRRQDYKKPPFELLAAAAIALSERGITPVVVCGPGEEADAFRVSEASLGRARLAPATSLMTLAAVLSEARLFVGGDSGPLHLACGVGCPVVGLYGPTDPLVNTPWNVPFAAVAPEGRTYTGIKRIDRAQAGFEGLTADVVVRAVHEVLETSSLMRRDR